MPKSERAIPLRLEDMLQAVGRIRTYVQGLDRETFENTPLVFDAVAMNFVVIGESVAKLPVELKSAVSPRPALTSWRTPCAA